MSRFSKLIVVLFFACALLRLVDAAGAGSWQSEKPDFVRDIQPIFQTHCVGCHGPNKSQAQLRLDEKASALTMIQPGNASASRLLQRVLGEGHEPRMPKGDEPLPPEKIELLRRWINDGANWPDTAANLKSQISNPQSAHWAFVAPQRPTLPAVKNAAWVKSPVDRFILATLEQKGLAPAPEADKATLIRRLSLDLIGLPPSLKEIDEFLADNAANAYEKLVERLLASPHYGERWGRWWLDAARYADTNGFEKDGNRSIWPYRDWVIKSFNQDKPFDQFTIEQIGGDLLPNASLEQKIATGFLRNSMLNEEAGAEPEQFRVEGNLDRVEAIGKAFLGLTVNCAQCHTHKFDPIKHDEYYKFYAFLDQDEEPEMEVPTPAEAKKQADILTGIIKLEDELMAKHPDLPAKMAAWEMQVKQSAGDWTVLEKAEVIGTNGVKFEEFPDRSFIPRGDSPPTVAYYLSAKTPLKNITGIRLELMTDHSLPRNGPGRSTQGVAWLSEFAVQSAPADQPEQWQALKFSAASADFAPAANPVSLAIDGNLKTSWSTDAGPGLRNQDRRAVFVLEKTLAGFAQGTLLKFSLSQKEYDIGRTQQLEAPNVGRFRISVTTAPDPQADPLPTNVRRILAVPAVQRTREQQREVLRYYRTTVPAFAETNKAANDLLKQWPAPATTLVVTPRLTPRETHIFKRGDWKRPGEAVTPDTPAFLHPFPQGAPRNRLGLGQWLADKNNPLTARVIVNRIWQQYFGQGLVSTPEDFGTRCEIPSHPELLDWLAVEFRDGEKKARPWSIKHIHKLIVMSATYRQSSQQTPQSVDGPNRWLARAPRLRVDAEAVRDIALAASGLLSLKIGGPSVFPPIPEGAMAVSFRSRTVWETSQGEDRYRRGMYTFWKRSVPYPSMSVFDAPNADMSCTRRIRSNSPLQALTTLNDTAFTEAAQSLALRVWKEGGADDLAKIRYGFRLCTSRWPDSFEENRLLQLLAKERGRLAGNTAAAVYVSTPDLNNLPANIDLHQLAAWTMVARVMLNLDETITKQ
jgi:Protein of unknown function (DUF1549)/Protein of unknown function (DUF1553)/Planctomycete cytochrome C